MAVENVGEIPKVSSEYPERDLVWSLRPIFLAMRIIGNDLDVIRRHTVYRRCAFLVLAVFILIFISYIRSDVFSNLQQVFQVYQHQEAIDQFQKVLNTIEVKLYRTTRNVFCTAIMVVQLMIVQLNWGNLWKKMQEMDQRGCLKTDHYNRIRKLVVISIIVIILLVFTP